MTDKPKMFPIQGGYPSVPWAMAEKAYVQYAKRNGTRQSLQDLADRCGFSIDEFACYFQGHDCHRCQTKDACIEAVNPTRLYILKLIDERCKAEAEVMALKIELDKMADAYLELKQGIQHELACLVSTDTGPVG